MNYLNVARAALEVMEIEGKGKDAERLIIMQETEQFLKKFHTENAGESQDDIAEAFKKERKKLEAIVEQSGVSDVQKKLDIAANYQGLKDKTYAVSTLTTVAGMTVETTSVPKTKLTEEQKKEFEAAQKWNDDSKPDVKTMPKWFQKLSSTEKELCAKHSDKIIAGHIIPTQLVKIPGMRNSYETVTRLHEKGQKPEIISRNSHSGSLACLGKDDKESTRLTAQNIRQAQESAGITDPKQFHYNTLNAGNNPTGHDGDVVSRSAAAAKQTGVSHTNTCFNKFRLVGGSLYADTKKQLETLVTNDIQGLNLHKEKKQAIIAHISPSAKDKPTMSLKDALTGSSLTDKQKETIELAAQLKEKLGKTATRGMDAENIDLQINENLAALSNATKESGFKTKIHHHTVCKSGKDRTGLAVHNMVVNAIKRKKPDIPLKDLDAAVLRGGHTAHMAGSVSAGGGGVGSMGTKSENKAGIPKSRKESLAPIMEKAAKYNKIKPPKLHKRILKGIKDLPKKIWRTVTRKKNNAKKYSVNPEYAHRMMAKKANAPQTAASTQAPIKAQAQTRSQGQIIRKALSTVKARQATAARSGGGRGHGASVTM